MAAVDLGGTHLRVAVFDADGGELFRHRIDTPADRPESLVGLIQLAVPASRPR
jgi:predicted NBD/HSP70 family sugar kinase